MPALTHSEAPPSNIALGLLPQLLGYRLRLTQRAVFADFRRGVGDGEVGPGLFGILEIVAANPGLKQTALAAALGVDRSTLVPALNRLEQRKMLKREPSPDDRRSNGLYLSTNGQRHLRVLRRRVARHERHLAERLTTAEHRTLMTLLDKLTGISI
ncbi:MAG: MarR family transcriptional regulator [Betaproteobacteria bacterium]|nr:MarR family transcriptional regulator [Betaproteobacteria bacterium]